MSVLSDKEVSTREALRISTLEGAWGTVHTVLTTGAFFTGFVLMLGGNDLQLSLLSAIPLLAQIFQLPGAYLVEMTGRRRAIVGWGAFIGRAIWLPIALIPFLLSGNVALNSFMLLFVLSGIAVNISSPGWVAWMSSLVPGTIRGRYFATRTRVTSIVSIAACLSAGYAIDFFSDHGHERIGYLALQLIAVGAAAAALRSILRQPDPGYRRERLPSVAHFIASPLRDPSYRRIVIFHLYWLFAIGLGAPFFNAHLLKHMNWNFRGTALLGVLFSVVSIMTQRFWGKFVDRFGHRPVLLITILGIVQLPLFYAFCPWYLRWPIYLNSLLGGVFWAGFSLAIFNLSMHALPPGGRSGYVAVFAAFSGVTHFAGTTLGGWLASAIAGVSWEVWGLPVVNYQILFILTTMLRASALILAYRISEPHATRTREVFRLAFAEINRRMSAGYNSIPNPLSQAWRGSTAHRPELKTTADDRVNRESLV